MVAWLNLDEDEDNDVALVEEYFRDSVQLSTEGLALLLAAAQEQCEAYAPALAEGAPVPARYRQAVILQARANWEASRRELGDADAYPVTVQPMDRTIMLLLRPRLGVRSVL
jgi:hypothetical protein